MSSWIYCWDILQIFFASSKLSPIIFAASFLNSKVPRWAWTYLLICFVISKEPFDICFFSDICIFSRLQFMKITPFVCNKRMKPNLMIFSKTVTGCCYPWLFIFLNPNNFEVPEVPLITTRFPQQFWTLTFQLHETLCP